MEKKQYIIPQAEVIAIVPENGIIMVSNGASGENYDAGLGSW